VCIYRYLIVVINGVKNPHRSAVAKDITDAILKTRAVKGGSAEYWSKDEQILKLANVFEKWSAKGGVWSAAASKASVALQ
jgi:hypothetical protein